MGRIRIIMEFLERYTVPALKYDGVSIEEMAKMLDSQIEAYEDARVGTVD